MDEKELSEEKNPSGTREEFINKLFEIYTPLKLLSKKEGRRVMLVEHKTLKKKIILRSCENDLPVYDFLLHVNCENLPKVYDVRHFHNGIVVIEEYIEGETVSDVLEGGLYSYGGAREVLRQLCFALSVLHENGYVHRDVKPENVMISRDGTVKLIDFDASRERTEGKKNDTRYLGTVGYAPPEQYGITQSDARSDVYAVGVMLNMMLTGCHPSEKLAKGKAGRIVRKSTMISPEDRYRSVEAMTKNM